jgi:hypothetical protein
VVATDPLTVGRMRRSSHERLIVQQTMTGDRPSRGRAGGCHDWRALELARGHLATCEGLGVRSRIKGVHGKRSQPGSIGRLPAVAGGRSTGPADHAPMAAEGDHRADPAVGDDRGGDFLCLRDTGSLTRGLQVVTSKDPSNKLPPGTAPQPQDADCGRAAPQQGLAGALLAIAGGLPDGLLGSDPGQCRPVDLVGLPDGAFAYPIARQPGPDRTARRRLPHQVSEVPLIRSRAARDRRRRGRPRAWSSGPLPPVPSYRPLPGRRTR